jgi:hypothetical protein
MRMDKAAVATLVVGLHGVRTPDSLERSIADALHDPAVKLGYWLPDLPGAFPPLRVETPAGVTD